MSALSGVEAVAGSLEAACEGLRFDVSSRACRVVAERAMAWLLLGAVPAEPLRALLDAVSSYPYDSDSEEWKTIAAAKDEVVAARAQLAGTGERIG